MPTDKRSSQNEVDYDAQLRELTQNLEPEYREIILEFAQDLLLIRDRWEGDASELKLPVKKLQ